MSVEETKKKVSKLMRKYLVVNLALIILVIVISTRIPREVSHLGLKLAFVGGELVIALIFYRMFFNVMQQHRRNNPN